MGQATTARIEMWQETHGVRPVRGPRGEMLERMSNLAVDLIKAIELERAGIRDGDGHWYGCDPITHIVDDIRECGDAHLDESERRRAWEASTDVTASPS